MAKWKTVRAPEINDKLAKESGFSEFARVNAHEASDLMRRIQLQLMETKRDAKQGELRETLAPKIDQLKLASEILDTEIDVWRDLEDLARQRMVDSKRIKHSSNVLSGLAELAEIPNGVLMPEYFKARQAALGARRISQSNRPTAFAKRLLGFEAKDRVFSAARQATARVEASQAVRIQNRLTPLEKEFQRPVR